MKSKSIVMIGLAVVIVVLAFLLFNSIMKPMRFDSEFYLRRDACAQRLKTVRTLEEAYKLTYGKYCGDFDTLIDRLMNEDSLLITQKIVNYDKIPEDVSVNDMPEADAVKAGYITFKKAYVNPIEQLREQNKLTVTDAEGESHELTNEEIKNVRYIPFPKGTKEQFNLEAGTIENNGFYVPVFECKVDLKTLMSDCDDQMVRNKIAEIERVSGKYAGWKVGDMTQSVTEGNFE